MPERLRSSNGVDGIGIEALARTYLFHIEHVLPTTVEGQEHLVELRNHIKTGGSVVFTVNHTSLLDPGVITAAIERVFKGLSYGKQLLISTKFIHGFYDELEQDEALHGDASVQQGIAAHKENELALPGRIIAVVGRMRKFELIPIVQHYLMGEGSFLRHNVEQNLRSFRRVIDAIKSGPMAVGISLEGTRSRNGTLMEAQRGINRLFRDPAVAEKTLVVPIALIGTDAVHHPGKGVGNPFAPVTVQFGEPVNYSEIREDAEKFSLAPEDILMVRIAAMLPDEMHGYYAGKEFQEYLAHCREHILPRSGVVYEDPPREAVHS